MLSFCIFDVFPHGVTMASQQVGQHAPLFTYFCELPNSTSYDIVQFFSSLLIQSAEVISHTYCWAQNTTVLSFHARIRLKLFMGMEVIIIALDDHNLPLSPKLIHLP